MPATTLSLKRGVEFIVEPIQRRTKAFVIRHESNVILLRSIGRYLLLI
jgi:hypothetical protein